ncbi:MAG: PIN domain-containing protein [Desulfobacterota bacterium]|jgi:predicted nucleic acid-binding protein|nr:PIN domain-containing protein [Thermodesulfobacteriota bacterium]
MKEIKGIFLLDTSALFTFIEDEEGADIVEKALKQRETLIPWPVLLEMYYITLQEEGQPEADKRLVLIKQLKVHLLYDLDEATLLTAARLKALHRVSLADAIIAAYAVRHGAMLMHKDPEYESLSGSLTLKPLPYKSTDGGRKSPPKKL